MPKGVVFDIARSSFFDGPGIRTTIFLKGCALDCPWCHNPEAKSLAPQPSTDPHTRQIKTIGRWMNVEQVMAVVVRDKAYYQESGGGMTLSGGEPLFQYQFALALAKKASAGGIHVAIETSGTGPWQQYEEISPYVDLFLYDYKISQARLLKKYTGADLKEITNNFSCLYRLHIPIILRCPIIPGINDHEEHIRQICSLSITYDRLLYTELLPYHKLGVSKAKSIQVDYPMPGARSLDNPRDLLRIKKLVSQFPHRKIILKSEQV